MPTAVWFASLPDERKVKAIQGSYLWKLAHDQERLWAKLGPYADHSHDSLKVFRNYRGQDEQGSSLQGSSPQGSSPQGSTYQGTPIDPSVAEMLDQVPDMLMEGFILMASSSLLDTLGVIAKVVRKYVPDVVAEITEEYEKLDLGYRLNSGTSERRLLAGRDRATGPLRFGGGQRRLWDALSAIRGSNPEAAEEIDRAWRMNARAEYLLRETLKATAGDF